jgi:hypothetical protein
MWVEAGQGHRCEVVMYGVVGHARVERACVVGIDKEGGANEVRRGEVYQG